MTFPGYISLGPISRAGATPRAPEADNEFSAKTIPVTPLTSIPKQGDAAGRSQRATFFSTLSKVSLQRLCADFLTDAQRIALTTNATGEELENADEAALSEGIKASLMHMAPNSPSGRAQKRARIDVAGSDLENPKPKTTGDQQLVPGTADPVLYPPPPTFPKLDLERAMRGTASQPWHLERQRDALCGQHAVNAILNQPYFTESKAIYCVEKEFGIGALDLKDNEKRSIYPLKDAKGNYSADLMCSVLNMALNDLYQHQFTNPVHLYLPQKYNVLWKNKPLEGVDAVNPAWDKLFDELMPIPPATLPRTTAFIAATGGHYIGCRWIDGHWRDLDSTINKYKNFFDLEERRIPEIKKFIEEHGVIGVIMDDEFVKHHASVS